jgi:3-oxoacyl-[acyl-carrier protein] reductase
MTKWRLAMLEGKVILVTGAAGGIGRAISLLCAQHGADIIVNDINSETEPLNLVEEIKQRNRRAIYIQADVSDQAAVKMMFKKIKTEFGRLDVLVNNAGILKDNLLLLTTEAEYNNVMNINLKGCFNCMQQAALMMRRQLSGKIINMASIVGRYGNAGQIVYSGTKAGVIGMTMSAAKELGPLGITVNAVAPGIIETNMILNLKAEAKQSLINATALKRIGTPMDVAKVVLFLASELSDYVSGQVIGVDGCQVV